MKHLFSSGLGIILFYGAVCGAIFALQALPVPGIFLMFLLAAFWIGVVVHVLMLHLSIAACTRTISLWWLLVPICYYAAGYLLSLYSEREAHIQAAAIEAANAVAGTKIKADQPFEYLIQGSQADQLFFRYKVFKAYEKNGMGGFVQYIHAYGPECTATLKWDPKSKEPYQFRPDLFPDYKGPDKVWQCATRQDVGFAERRYRLETKEIREGSYLNPRAGIRWRLVDEKTGTTAAVETASIGMLAAVPTIAAGCGLNDSSSTWDCYVMFWPSDKKVTAGYKPHLPGENANYDPEAFPVSAIGRAISLEPRWPNKR
jgi:hypothetical protein